jgi:hypothetical protein
MHWFGLRNLASIVSMLWREDHPPRSIAGLSVMDLRPDRHLDHDQVKATFEEAVDHIAGGDPAFLALAHDNIAQITVYDLPHYSVVWWSRHLNTPLRVRVRRNTFYLACRLVWAGAYFAALRSVPFVFRPLAKNAARKGANQAWLAFVRQFPDAEEWEAYLKAHECD